MKQTEAAYQLSDEFYSWAARRDCHQPGQNAASRVSRMPTVGCSGRVHGQRCTYNSATTKLREGKD